MSFKKHILHKDIGNRIFKYQKEDIIVKLIRLKGEKFKKYREDFTKTQNFIETGFIPDFPITIYLELINRCNLKCIMCPTSHHSDTKNELKRDLLRKIFSEFDQNDLSALTLGMGGEQFLYRDIKHVFKTVQQSCIQDVFVATNGILLSDDIISKIIEYKFTRLRISIDAAKPETYYKIRGCDKLELIESNILKVMEQKKKNNSELPIIRLSFVVMPENCDEIEEFINKWEDKVDYIDFQMHIDFSYINKNTSIDNTELQNCFCSSPFCSMGIWSNGDISPCCSFYGTELIFGNIKEISIKDAWNSDFIKCLREEIVSKKFNSTCAKCLYFQDRKLL